MILTVRKVKDKYCLVDKETGKVKKSFETKAEALAYEVKEEKEKSEKSDYYKPIKTIKR